MAEMNGFFYTNRGRNEPKVRAAKSGSVPVSHSASIHLKRLPFPHSVVSLLREFVQ